jgi:membrane peptidoglycan carboxypeptidase
LNPKGEVNFAMRKLVDEFVDATSTIAKEIDISAPKWRAGRAVRIWAWIVVAAGIAILVAQEMRTSWFQSHILTAAARRLTYAVQPGPSPKMHYPNSGPYDDRLGYTTLPLFQERLRNEGFEVTAQARISTLSRVLGDLTLFPVYHDKSRAGLQLMDYRQRTIFAWRYPERVYPEFDSIPPLIVNSLLFIENRELLDVRTPHRNPALEWDRLAKAVKDVAIQKVHRNHPISGGSTLATQLEKIRHSPQGRTSSVIEKARQMASAALRSYLDGEDTIAARKQIVCLYLNSLPLASCPGSGEIQGLGDGLWAWFGADFEKVNQLLALPETELAEGRLVSDRATAFRQVVSLLLAIKKPSEYLPRDTAALNTRVDAYFRLLSDVGLVSPRLRDAALSVHLNIRDRVSEARPTSFEDRKAADSVRAGLLHLLGIGSTYDLDRLDLTARTTLDREANAASTNALKRLSEPSYATAAGVTGEHLLSANSLDSVIYSFTLYERSEAANLLRIQVDNLDQPLNVNQGTKLELGSTAKLRTLGTYLETIAELYEKYFGAREQPAILNPQDRLSRWAIDYLASATDRSLGAMLEAAMNRTYSASPGEQFFTGGGLHQFANFDSKDNGRMMTVRHAFQRSVNLVFIRLMRDLVNYQMFRKPGVQPQILQDENNPVRRQYLRRFADWEGQEFLRRFYQKYAGRTPNEALEMLVSPIRPTPRRLAVIYRSARPEATFDQFTAFLTSHPSARNLRPNALENLYRTYGPEQFNLNDRGYLARVHPLELWLLEYLHRRPRASLTEVLADSVPERQDVYRWLFKAGRKHAQDLRIRTLLEIDAFAEIHHGWCRLGYPFPRLVPSFATAIGSSGDNPAALAELVGIILNDGIRYPVIRIEGLQFAQGTPFETLMTQRPKTGQRVLHSLIANTLKKELVGVVENGTARRGLRSVVLSDGRAVPVGGKTGTGDNRVRIHGPSRVGSRAISRTAAFVFFIGERFFGTVVAYVPGAEAASYHFTSALPIQVFKQLVPGIRPLLESNSGGSHSVLAQ